MKRLLFSLFTVLMLCTSFNAMAAFSGGQVLYLEVSNDWKSDGARFAACLCYNGGANWYNMTLVEGNVYKMQVPNDGTSYTHVLFCRMNPGTTDNNWGNKWNQTGDLYASDWGSNNCYKITGWDNSGYYTTYTTKSPDVLYFRGDDTGSDWPVIEMTKDNNVFTLSTTLTNGNGFKFTTSQDWSGNQYTVGGDVENATEYTLLSGGNNSVWKGKTGSVDIKVDFSDVKNPKLTITENTVITSLYFAGNIFDAEGSDHWGDAYEMTTVDNGVFTWTGMLYQYGEFKFRNNTGNDWDISFTTNDNNTYKLNEALPIYQDGENGKWTASTGEYKVTVDVNAMTVTFEEVAVVVTDLYLISEANWDDALAMTTIDNNTYVWEGELYGAFKFRIDANTSFGQFGSTDGNTINIGASYPIARTSTDAMQTFKMANAADNKMHVKVIVNLSENTMRVLPADVFIAGDAVVEVKESGAWSTSTVQGCVHNIESDIYTWTGYLYNNNGDDDARFKFILASGYSNGGHLVPVAATTPDYDYDGVTYDLKFLWDVDVNGESGNQLFHAVGTGLWAADMAAGVMENGTTTRIKVRAEIDLGAMTVTFYKIDELHIENLFISGDATEHTAVGYGAMQVDSDTDGTFYYSITNFVDNTSGFYFPLQDNAAYPALVAWEDDYVTTYFAKHGYDYSGHDGAVQNKFNVPSAGVYKVLVRPDYNEVRVYPYDVLLPADGAFIPLVERNTTYALKATFFEEVIDFDPSKVRIESEYMWWTGDSSIPCQVVAREGGIDGKTVIFGVNSFDGYLADDEKYTVTFEQGAVTFASTTRAGEARINPEFCYSITIEDDPEIGSGVDRVEVAYGIEYANGVVTADGVIEVYNVGGTIVARGNDSVDLSALNSGVYIVRNGDQVRKVVR